MAQPLDPNAWRQTVGNRLLVVAAILGLWAAAIETRLVFLQVVNHDFYVAEARSQQEQIIDIKGRRGDIVDRHGAVLAYSADAESVAVWPAELNSVSFTIDAVCRALGGCSSQEISTLRARLDKKRGMVWVRRAVPSDAAAAVAALNIKGVRLIREPHRYYPKRELAAHVLGYVGVDEQGLNGIEERYDRDFLRGRPGKLLVQQDNRKRPFSLVGDPPVPGKTLELTIDSRLQYLAERELHAGVVENRAAGGVAIIMDPATGEILAMASEPTYNPNDYQLFDENTRKNRAVEDTYEPGSTFKMVTATAGLEERVVNPETPLETGNGVLVMEGSGRVVRDTHAHGTIPFREAIAMSSNIGAIRVGWKLGIDRLYKYVTQYGFGTRLSPDFGRHESAGIVWPSSVWKHDGTLASVAMGYEIGVTPLQMAAAASAIANGGELLKPRVLRAVIDGNSRRLVPRTVIRRVASPETFATLLPILEEVVESGTAKTTQIEGYTSAGKTGTSAKLVKVGNKLVYSKSEYNASFVGFVPSRNPAMTILVWIDSPGAGKTYGGVVAGPVFQRIATQALRTLAVPANVNPPAPVLVTRQATNEIRVAGPVSPLTILAPPPAPTRGGDLVLPELRGLGGRDALRVLARLGLSARVSGDGVVLEQDPAAGSEVEAGAGCRLVLGRVVSREVRAGGERP
jgi:cell division protein FtsI (penicillin-binding protein 3)